MYILMVIIKSIYLSWLFMLEYIHNNYDYVIIIIIIITAL